MDVHSKEIRSYNMSCIKGKKTKPEEVVAKYLFAQGFRYRRNVRGLPGTPDIVLKKYRIAIFVNGCFWHCHWGVNGLSFLKRMQNSGRRNLIVIVKEISKIIKNYRIMVGTLLLSGNVKSGITIGIRDLKR